ncbi:DUF1571 domain-containing protein [Schlesneria sp. DSM 10557]|uniref:DUF1571 domain-containing protein n=1 Tax=Schlesneria sp. DSM 10557 TaxID=3044399 RepID=UPI0035A00AD0
MKIIRLFRCLSRDQAANSVSIMIALAAIVFLHLESSPTPAGADIARRITKKQTHVIAAARYASRGQAGGAEGSASGEGEDFALDDLSGKIRLLERGMEFLGKVPHYTAVFVKQELVNGELLDEQEMEMKVRHQPFSVYLKWSTGEVGREVLYVDGMNDGRITAHGGGWKARLPTVSLEPNGSMAMAESRHPITKAGLYSLAQMMVEIHREDLEKQNYSRFEKLPDEEFDGRPCHVYLIEYRDRQACEHYRKSITYIDKGWSLPVYTKNYGWLDGQVPANPDEYDSATLLEYYSFANIKFRSNLVALDFDHNNSEYGFKRQ